MKHRHRVAMALAHEETDRCPMQISFTPEFVERVEQEINNKSNKRHNPHGGGNTYLLERLLGEDMLLTSVGWANNYYQTFEPGAEYTDDWGSLGGRRRMRRALAPVSTRNLPRILWQTPRPSTVTYRPIRKTLSSTRLQKP